MKIEWEIADIKPGRVVGKPGRKERWMIGYVAADQTEHRWTLVSLSDGMIQIPRSADLLATSLTESGELPAEVLPRAESGIHS